MRLRTYGPRIIIRIFALFLLVPSMKSASFIFDRRLYELLQEPGRTSFTTRELRDAYAARLSGTKFRIADVRRYPSADQVFSLGRLEECLVNDAQDNEYRRRVIEFHQPLFSSSLDFTL